MKSIKWPGKASLNVDLLAMKKGFVTTEQPILDNVKVGEISTYFQSNCEVGDPFQLNRNKNQIFTGYFFLGDGFLLTNDEAKKIISENTKYKDVVLPFINGDDLNNDFRQKNSRHIINFFDFPLNKEYDLASGKMKGPPYASDYPDCLKIIEELVKPERQRWKKDEKGNPIQGFVDAHAYYQQFHPNRITDDFVHNADYIKLREVSLGYSLPKKYLGGFLQKATVSLIGRNLWLISVAKDNIHRWDPSELSQTYGEDGQLPSTRSYGMNIKLTF